MADIKTRQYQWGGEINQSERKDVAVVSYKSELLPG